PVAADGAGAAVLHDRGEHPGRGWAGHYRFGALVHAVSSHPGAQLIVRRDRFERAGDLLDAEGAGVHRLLRAVSPASANGLLGVGAGLGDLLFLAVPVGAGELVDEPVRLEL